MGAATAEVVRLIAQLVLPHCSQVLAVPLAGEAVAAHITVANRAMAVLVVGAKSEFIVGR